MKKGLLAVNPFLIGAKYDDLYSLLTAAFSARGAKLEMKTTDKFVNTLGDRSVIDKNEYDFVIFWDKDAYLAKAFENSGVKVFNSSSAIEICDDKIKTCLALQKYGVQIPETIIPPKTFENIGYTDLSFVHLAAKRLGYPFVIKEACGSFGKQVYLAENAESAAKILRETGGRAVLFQKYVKESSGRDIRVNVVGGQVVATILRVNENDFRSNVSNGGKAYPYEISEKQKQAAINALNAVNGAWGGVDILLNDGEPMVMEVNSNMHFASTFNATGVNVGENIAEHVLKNI